METPQVRPGRVLPAEPMPRIVAFFPNTAQGNAAIQWLVGLGLPSDRLGITPPERIASGQGLVLSVGCPDETLARRAEDICRRLGAQIHKQKP